MDPQQLAAFLCELKNLAAIIPQAQCRSDGTACVPTSPDQCGPCTPMDLGLLSALATASAMAALQELLEQILEELQQQPQIEAGGYQLLCKEGTTDGYYLLYFVHDEDAGTSETRWVDDAGAEGSGLPDDAVQCPETKVVSNCFVDRSNVNDPVYYTQVVCIKAGQIIGVIWIDANGTILPAAPTSVERCETEPWQAVEVCVNGTDSAIAHITDSGSVLGVFHFNAASYELYTDTITDIQVGLCVCAPVTEPGCLVRESSTGRCPDFTNDTPVFQQDVFGGSLGNLTTSDLSGGAVANVLGAIQLTDGTAAQALRTAIDIECHITIVMDDDFQFYSFWHEQLVESPAGSGNFLIVDTPDPCGFSMSPITDDDIQTAFLVRAFCFVEEPDAATELEYIPVEIVKSICNGEIESVRVYSPDGTTEYTLPLADGESLMTGACPIPCPDDPFLGVITDLSVLS